MPPRRPLQRWLERGRPAACSCHSYDVCPSLRFSFVSPSEATLAEDRIKDDGIWAAFRQTDGSLRISNFLPRRSAVPAAVKSVSVKARASSKVTSVTIHPA